MTRSVHGHDVMGLMLAHGKPLTQEALIALIHKTFGEECRFHTCSASELSAMDLLALLRRKGKVIECPEGLTTEKGRICHH